MKPLSKYLKISTGAGIIPAWDGHVHLFSHRGPLEHNCAPCVGFADIELDHLDEYKDLPGMYRKYMDKFKGVRWLATGMDINQIKEVAEALGDRCAGFGELKLYDVFKDKEVPYKRISLAREVCRYSQKKGNLPVYIHYELTNLNCVARFENLLKDFPEVPIVLCHCGMNEKESPEFAWNQCGRMVRTYSNLYLDLSWAAAKYLSTNPFLLTQLPPDRCFWGSDFSPRLEKHGYISATPKEIHRWRDAITPFINSDATLLGHLFPEKPKVVYKKI